MSLKEWLQIPCLPEEVQGDEQQGYYLALETIRGKLKYMESTFNARLYCYNFTHFLFNRMDKEVFASGSMDVEILIPGDYPDFEHKTFKRLVGAYSFNIRDYDNPPHDENSQYAGTLKSLCLRNSLLEYPQFGSELNKAELVRIISGRRNNFKTSSAAKEAVKI